MKRGRKSQHLRYAFMFVFIVALGVLVGIWITKYSLNKITGLASTESTGVTATVGNVAPSIFNNNLDGTTNIILLAGSTRKVNVSFRAQDNNGYNDINATSLNTFVSITNGATTRQSTSGSCIKSPGGSPKRADINCSVDMQYFDKNATDWIITVSVGDVGGLSGSNSARLITVDLLKDISITTNPPSSPNTLNFSILTPGSFNQPADNDPINITNNGNFQGRIIVDGFNLSNGINTIPITSFSAHNNTGGEECLLPGEGGNATQLTDTSGGNIITNSSLPRGPIGSNVEELFFCADSIPDPLSSGIYSAATSWSIII